MEKFVWIGFLAFFVASLTCGIHLVRLWTRTRELPELLIGVGVLGIGPVGFGISTLAEVVRTARPGLASALFGLAMLAVGMGCAAKYVFNWRVYHPNRPATAALAVTASSLLALCWLYDLVSNGFSHPYELTLAYAVRGALQVGCLAWGAGEALAYWTKLRRRMRLGLADAVVTNRFLLWGIGAGAAGLGSAIGLGAQFATGLAPLEIPWLMLSSSLHGLTAAVAMWLAFVPPERYVRFIAARAPRPA